MKFLGGQDKRGCFLVIVRDVNHSEAVANMQRNLDNIRILDPQRCGIDKRGNIQCDGVSGCSNEVANEFGELYCSVLAYAQLEKKMQKWTWMPQMLDNLWKNGVVQDGLEFLEGSGFVRRYKYGRLNVLQIDVSDFLTPGTWPTIHSTMPKIPMESLSMLWS